jgi:general secretion pathway protein N
MRWGLLASGACAYAAALVALAPATLLDAQLQRVTEGRLRLAEARGSLWSGEGWVEVRDTDGKVGVARRLAWRVLPESLLRARLVAEVELDQAAKPFTLSLSPSRLHVAGADIQLPAMALALGLPRLAPFRLSGELLVSIADLAIERGGAHGSATLHWRGAGSALTPIAPLGDYEVRIKAVGPAVHAVLSTLAGPLQLEGKGTWANGAAPSFLAMARVAPQHQEELAPLLRLIAIERTAGSFELSSARAAFGS